MKKILSALVIAAFAIFIFVVSAFAAEFTSTSDYPTKLVYDEATKTMTITYAGSGGWHELMPISDNGDRSILDFLDKYRTEIEHIDVGKFGKIQIIDKKDESGNVTASAKLFSGMTALKSVHFAEGQRILHNSVCGLFENCSSLTTVWFGAESNKIEGCANFTGCNTKDNDNAKGQHIFAKNLFKGCSSLKSVIYTVNPNESVVFSSTFEGCTALKSIKLGDNIKNVDAVLFESFKIIDLESGAEMTEPLPAPEGGTATEPDPQPQVPSTPPSSEFKPDGATIWGHSTGEYNDKKIIDTYWAYYDETKTLVFTSLTTSYNETGAIGNCDETDWSQYRDVIEHVIVGDNIAKVSGSAFKNYPALRDVRLGKQIAQIDTYAFENCPNLTTIWRDGKERIEGRADFSGCTRFMDCLVGTSISELIMPEKPNTLEINMPMTVKKVYSANITEELKAHAETNLYNLINLNDPSEKYEYYIFIDPNLPLCGSRAVFDFDEATGILTVYGAGAITDIINYHGGGSKNQPWFSIKQKIKHVVITDRITTIGKYAFAQCRSLESVQIPNVESFIISAAAFEGCENMKSIYIEGNEPIEGTVDIRNVHTVESWTFAYNYLIANAVISPQVEKIGNSVFSDNPNLANIYGTPGSFAERYAENCGFKFFDISAETPQPIKCTPPESETEGTSAPIESESESTVPDTTAAPDKSETETESKAPTFIKVDKNAPQEEEGTGIMPIAVIGVAVALAVIAATVIIIIFMRKKAKK